MALWLFLLLLLLKVKKIHPAVVFMEADLSRQL